MNDTKKRSARRWLQFSLRSVLIAMLAVSAYFAGWRSAVWKSERDKQQAIREALDEFKAAMEQGDTSMPFVDDVEIIDLSPSQEQLQRTMNLQKWSRPTDQNQRHTQQDSMPPKHAPTASSHQRPPEIP